MDRDLSKLSLNELVARYSTMMDKYDNTAAPKYWQAAQETRAHIVNNFERKSDADV